MFLQVSSIFHYFSEYEISLTSAIRKDDIIRALQESIYPHWFSKTYVDYFFKGLKSTSFLAYVGFYYSMRMFSAHSDGLLLIEKVDFDDMLDSGYVPARFVDYIEHVYIPTIEEIEEASK